MLCCANAVLCCAELPCCTAALARHSALGPGSSLEAPAIIFQAPMLSCILAMPLCFLIKRCEQENEEFVPFHDFSQVPILQLANSLAIYLHAGSSPISHFTWLIVFVFSTGLLAVTAHCEVTDSPLCFQKPASPSPCKTENEW